MKMFSQSATSTTTCDAVQADSRLAVADILSSMARDDHSDIKTYTSLNGFSTAVPTRTTPTFTPTTLRNIEETFIELQSAVPPMPTEHLNQAGFVPPVVLPATGGSTSSSPSPMSSYGMTAVMQAPRTGRNMGGRRPNRDDRLSPEEEERRRVRRERNKMAAARCRKRRLDHTNSLVCETDCLEGKRSRLQDEIIELEKQKEELEFILDAHKAVCTLHRQGNNGSCGHHDVDVKPIIVVSVSSACGGFEQPAAVPKKRPADLPLHSRQVFLRGSTVHEPTGITITTPSNGIFNFESLMEGGTGMTPVSTGLTPVVPTCSHQQRSSGSDLSSPDSIPPSKLVSL